MVFSSVATDLVPSFVQKSGGSPFGYDIYLRDTVGGTTMLISHAVGLAATGGTGESGYAVMTPDGLTLAFQSAFPTNPDNLVSKDTYGQTQLFATTLNSLVATAVAAVSGTGTYGGTGILTATLTANGTPLAGKSVAFTLTVGGTQTKRRFGHDQRQWRGHAERSESDGLQRRNRHRRRRGELRGRFDLRTQQR